MAPPRLLQHMLKNNLMREANSKVRVSNSRFLAMGQFAMEQDNTMDPPVAPRVGSRCFSRRA